MLLSDLRTRRPVSLSEPADTRLRVFGLTSLTQLAELAFNPTPQGILQSAWVVLCFLHECSSSHAHKKEKDQLH